MAREINNIDYEKRLDDDLKDFIKKIENHSDATAGDDIKKIRDSYSKVCTAFKSALPPEVKIETKILKSNKKKISYRVYKKNARVSAQILYAHGGGFIMGGLESHNEICADICHQTDLTVTAVDYRLSPENKHPAAFEDMLDVYRFLDPKVPIILVGDSAGATLMAMLSHYLKNKTNNLRGQVLIYPYLGGDMTTGSYLKHANAPCLTTNQMIFFVNCWRSEKKTSIKLPLNESDFLGLTPTVVFTASDDPLNLDGVSYVKKIKLVNGNAVNYQNEGLVHGYLRARHIVDKARCAFSKITDAISRLANQNELN